MEELNDVELASQLKMFNMMEIFTQRIIQIDNQIEMTIHKTSDAI